MMRIALQALLAFAAVASGPAAKAAVMITELAEPVLIYDDFLGTFYPIDINGDQSADFTLAADPSSSALRTERGNRAIYRTTTPPDLGGPIPPLVPGYIIGPDLATSSFGELAWRSSDLLGGYVDPDEIAFISISRVLSNGSSSLFPVEGLRAPIGVEFEAEDGIHYGYIDIWARRGYTGIYVHGWAYESEPGVPIAAAVIPEPETSVLLGVGLLLVVGGRIRKRQGTTRRSRATDGAAVLSARQGSSRVR